MAAATALLVFLFLMPMAHAAQYTVGNSAGWTQGVDYRVWTAGKTFVTGDTLLFTYDGTHKVDVVGQSDYNNCASGNALESYSDGNTVITLNKTGPMYFLCPTSGHCAQGMKLTITVSAGNATSPTSPSPPASPSPPGTSTPPTTPSPPSTSTPPPPTTSGAAPSMFYTTNFMVLAAPIILAPLLALLG